MVRIVAQNRHLMSYLVKRGQTIAANQLVEGSTEQ